MIFTRKPIEKDGKLAWMVLAVAFIIQTIVFGHVLCFGIYFVTLLDYFQCHKSEVAAIGAMAYGMLCLTGPIASILAKTYGSRVVCMAGGLTASLGLFLSSFAPNVPFLYFSFGFLGGFGFGLAYTPTVGVLGDYFDRWKYFATSIVSVGSAVGTFLFSPIFLHLIEQYGWRGSLLINSGVVLHICLLATLLISRSPPAPLQLPCSNDGQLKELVANWKFWVLAVDNFIYGGGVYMVFVMINSYVMSRGISQADSAILVSTIGLANVIGRFSSSLIAHCSCTSRICFFVAVTYLLGAAMVGLTLCEDLWSFAACAGLFGLTFGSRISQLAGVLIDTFGLAHMLSSFGFMMFSIGLGGISFPSFAGYLAEVVDLNAPFYVAAGTTIFGAILSSVLAVSSCRK